MFNGAIPTAPSIDTPPAAQVVIDTWAPVALCLGIAQLWGENKLLKDRLTICNEARREHIKDITGYQDRVNNLIDNLTKELESAKTKQEKKLLRSTIKKVRQLHKIHP